MDAQVAATGEASGFHGGLPPFAFLHPSGVKTVRSQAYLP